ncbi:hypothetical protein HG530_003567 [Fusarium avenaceum]|nr:hypothetical protein HG530_003567 [Fusarium avenaceum]
MARDSSYGLNERRVVGESIIRLPFTDAPGCSSGTIFDTYSNGDGEDCGHNTDKADPSKPTDFAEGSNTGAKECQDGGNGHENGGASGTRNARDDAKLVKCHGDTENSEADLGLHHEGDGGNPAKLQFWGHSLRLAQRRDPQHE